MSDSMQDTQAKRTAKTTPPRGPRPFVGRKAEQGTVDPSSGVAAPRRVNAPFKPYVSATKGAIPAEVPPPATPIVAPAAPEDVVASAATSTLDMEIAAAFDAEPAAAGLGPDAGNPDRASEIVTEAAIADTEAGIVHASPAAVAFARAFESAEPEPTTPDTQSLPDIRDLGYDSGFLTEEPLLGLTPAESSGETIDEVDAAFIATGSPSLPEGSPHAVQAAQTLESIARRLRMGALEVPSNEATDLTRDETALATVLAALLSGR